MANRGRSLKPIEWLDELPCAVTVCDKDYSILYMNDMAAEATKEDGGRKLIGKSLLDCHPPRARRKLIKVMESGKPNIYTAERGGVRKMVYQCHWRSGGVVSGLLELTFVLPKKVPRHVRK